MINLNQMDIMVCNFFVIYSKINQRGFKEAMHTLFHQHLPMIMKILNKRPDLADDDFYLQPNPSWLKYGIWYRTTHARINRFMQNIENIGRDV